MSIFSKIKDAIFGHAVAQAPAPASPAPTPAASAASVAPAAASAPAAPLPQTPVDVEAVLHDIWVKKGSPALNYKSSIVDLMKLLDLDSSLSNREQLAIELGHPGAKDGSAEMNIWLHQQVMLGLEKDGGKIPDDLKG